MEKIKELRRKLAIAEQNYKDTRADAYLVEKHQLEQEIAMLESEAQDAAPVSQDGGQSPTTEPVRTEVAFQPPTNVDELPSAITRHIVAVSGADIHGMDDRAIAIEQRKLLYEARSFYDGQNDKDALERVDSMIGKATAIIDGTAPADGAREDNAQGSEGNAKPVEATEPTPEAPQTKEPTKNPQPQKKATSGQKKSGKGGKK